MNKVMKTLTLLDEIREHVDNMLGDFDAGGNKAHVFWLHVDDEKLAEVTNILRDMRYKMLDDEARRD